MGKEVDESGGQSRQWLWNVGYAAGGAALALIAQAFFLGAAWGEQVSKVGILEKRVEVLEKGLFTSVNPGKGDLCLKLLDAQVEAYRRDGTESAGAVEKQLRDLGCYNVNATIPEEEARKMGFPPKAD